MMSPSTRQSARSFAGATILACVLLVVAGLARAPDGATATTAPARAAALPPAAAAPAALDGRDFVPGEAIVRFEPGTGAAGRRAARAAAGVEFDRSADLPRTQVVALDGRVRDVVDQLERDPRVELAQPNYVYRALTDDPRYDDLWGLPAVGAPTAWSTTRGSGQVIAILDTGVDLTHPDLAPRLWANPSPDPADDDLHGYDFVADDGTPDDFHYHGTHVAGTAAAAADNGIGIAGVAPDARIMAVRVLNADGIGYSDQVAAGVDYAAAHGADVINMSLGGPAGAEDALLAQAVADAGTEHDTVVVVAAGNGGSDGVGDSNDLAPQSPCQAPDGSQPPNLVCVAATAPSGQLTGFSNWGAASVHLAAPGQGIWSARPPYGRVYPAAGAPYGFESAPAFGNDWARFVGTTAWGRDGLFAQAGSFSAADTPGANYANGATASLVAATDTSLVGRRGCRMQFWYRLRLADDGDTLMAGLLIGSHLDVASLADTGTGFLGKALSFEQADGKPAVAPVFWLRADAAGVDEGANVDEVELICRSESYTASSYQSLNGTSMAAPHVAGVAALVRAAAPQATADEIVAALIDGVAPLTPTPGRPTLTDGIVDAPGAIAAAGVIAPPEPPGGSGGPGEDGGQDGTANGQDGAGGGSQAIQRAEATPRPPAKASLRASRRFLRVSRRGTFAYSFRAAAGLTGRATFRAGRTAVASKLFAVPRRGRVTVRVALTPKRLRALRRRGRLALVVTVRVRDRAGRAATERKRLTLRPPRR